MTTFDDRERGYENKFANDQEKEFKIIARRNKLLGLWASEKMGLDEENSRNYATGLVEKTAQKNSSALLLQQIHEDFTTLELQISKDEIEKEMEKLLQVASDQVLNIG
jgi:hypothetical protein